MTVHAPTVKPGVIYYGWVVASLGFLGNLMGVGISIYVFSVFFLPMAEEFGWTRAMVAGVITLRSLVGAATGPLVGPLIDRKHGARVVMTVGSFMGGVSLIALGAVHALWQLYLVFGLLWGVATIGMGELVGGTIVSKWFVRQRGRAVAFSSLGMSLGGAFLIPLSQMLIDSYGWRTAWVVLGIILLVILVPLSAIFMRRSPEDVGLLPDGDGAVGAPRGTHAAAARQAAVPERSWTLREAFRTRTLWWLMLALTLASLPMTGMLIHVVPALRDIGLTARQASLAFTIWGILAASAKVVWGFVVEKVHVRYCAMVIFLGSALGLAVLMYAHDMATAFLFVGLMATFAGGFAPISVLLWANYYGRGFLGALRGVYYPVSVAASASAPLLAGYLRDVSGSYNAALMVFIPALLASAVFMFLARPPRGQQSRPVEAAGVQGPR